MSEKEQVSQPQKDVPAVEVKETQADNKTQPQFTQEQVDKIIQTRRGAEKAKQEKALAEIQKKDDERKKEQEIKDAKTKSVLSSATNNLENEEIEENEHTTNKPSRRKRGFQLREAELSDKENKKELKEAKKDGTERDNLLT